MLGRRIASLGLPSLIVMEGGYAVDALGANVASFLGGLKGGARPFRKTERVLDQLFHAKLEQSADFATWLLSRTKFSGARAKLVSAPWQFQWYRSPTTGVESETDIFLIFEAAADGSRFALHIENKLTASSFRPRQAELYAERARDWMERRNYHDYETILIAPQAFHDRYPEQARLFDRYIPHEDIAAFIPEFS